LGPDGRDEAPRNVVNIANLPELPQRKPAHGQTALVSRLMPQLPRHGLGPIASGQHPSVVTKHDQSPEILLDAGSVDWSGDLEVGVPIEDLLDTGVFTTRLEKLDRVFCNVGRHCPVSVWATE
jgi:hypothetical protein